MADSGGCGKHAFACCELLKLETGSGVFYVDLEVQAPWRATARDGCADRCWCCSSCVAKASLYQLGNFVPTELGKLSDALAGPRRPAPSRGKVLGDGGRGGVGYGAPSKL